MSNEAGRKEVAGYMELAKNKADLNKVELVVKFIHSCFDKIEAKVAENPNDMPTFTRQDVL